MAYFRSDIDIIVFFVGRDENEWVGGLFVCFLPRREPKGGRSGRWEHTKKNTPPLHRLCDVAMVLLLQVYVTKTFST